MPLILALGRQNQADLSMFKASLMYIVSFRTAKTTCLETNKQQQQNIIHIQRTYTVSKREKMKSNVA